VTKPVGDGSRIVELDGGCSGFGPSQKLSGSQNHLMLTGESLDAEPATHPSYLSVQTRPGEQDSCPRNCTTR